MQMHVHTDTRVLLFLIVQSILLLTAGFYTSYVSIIEKFKQCISI